MSRSTNVSKQGLAQRGEARIRAEWPGPHITDQRGFFETPEIRPGGATDALVKLMARIIREESGDE